MIQRGFRWISALSLLLVALALAPRAAAEGDVEFFETRIRPVLVEHCYECHSTRAGKSEGGLLLDSRRALRAGGESGPALVPGTTAGSRLLRALRYDDVDLQMPPEGRLPDSVIADFEAWIQAGATDPREDAAPHGEAASDAWPAEFLKRKAHWSLQPVHPVEPPHATGPDGSANPIDRFIAAKHQELGLTRSVAADKTTLLRRVSYALTGLPPSATDIEAFLGDASPDAYERVIDRLLASPRFGERFATHWLDLVRYADTHGSEGDPEIPSAWRYRDFVIRAFDADVPFDRFVREQIAGDLLAESRVDLATGINESAIGPAQFRFVEHGFQPVDSLDERAKTIDNQIDVLSKAFQGLTIACARCHDHKFDAISQRDYYALYGILASSRPAQVTVDEPAILHTGVAELTSLKARIKSALAEAWLESARDLPDRLIRSNSLPKSTPAEQRLAELDRLALAAVDHERAVAASLGFVPRPVAAWSFDTDGQDAVGDLDAELVGGAVIEEGRLKLAGDGAFARTPPLRRAIREKTLEAWVALDSTDQRGSGVISLQSNAGDVFDSIVFGELQPGRWAAGSDFLRRSRNLNGPVEAATPSLIHLVAVHAADGSIQLFRNGDAYGSRYTPDGDGLGPLIYEAGASHVVLGMRHAAQGPLAGEIEEARLYDIALTEQQVRNSFRRGPGTAAEAQLTAALPAEFRDERTRLRAVVAELRSERAATAARPSVDPWAKAISEAQRDRTSPLSPWVRLHGLAPSAIADEWRSEAEHWNREIAGRKAFNRERFSLLWDLNDDEVLSSWNRQGVGVSRSAAPSGEFAIATKGENVVAGLYPSGVFTHLLSQKQNGLLTSPRFVLPKSLAIRMTGDHGGGVRVIVDGYPLGTNDTYPQRRPAGGPMEWVRLDTSYRAGSEAYLEFATFEDLPRPAPAKGGKPPRDGRSYFGVSTVVAPDQDGVAPEDVPQDEVVPVLPLLTGNAPGSADELAARYADVMRSTITAWRDGRLTDAEATWLDFFIRNRLLPNTLDALPNIAPLVAEYRRLEEELSIPRRAPGVVEAQGVDSPLFIRGNPHNAGSDVPRGYPTVLGGRAYETSGSGRLELADDIASPQNPLTSRVAVNRLWHWLFGRGIAPTTDNFGRLGEPPSHPQLLDYLASRFVEDGWSVKQLVRLIVTSQTYRMSSTSSDSSSALDPANIWLSRFPVRRLEAEAIRDGMLAMADELDSTRFGVGVADPPFDGQRRSVYLSVRRTAPHALLEVFDKPSPMSTRGRRDVTTLPAQSLALLNSTFTSGLAMRWGRQLAASSASPDQRVERVFVAALGRPPSPPELRRSLNYVNAALADYDLTDDAESRDPRPWQDLVQSIFCLKETIYVR
ncbi:MAG: DUF1553 domain-containing protein [Planctomycetaceae bacterium]|nr:DUF1553 domain-containing protein [Planctomycetaceae bacterium]